MGKKKKPISSEPVPKNENGDEKKSLNEMVEAASEDPKDYTSEWIAEDQCSEEIAEPIHNHAKFDKFKKPLGGE